MMISAGMAYAAMGAPPPQVRPNRQNTSTDVFQYSGSPASSPAASNTPTPEGSGFTDAMGEDPFSFMRAVKNFLEGASQPFKDLYNMVKEHPILSAGVAGALVALGLIPATAAATAAALGIGGAALLVYAVARFGYNALEMVADYMDGNNRGAEENARDMGEAFTQGALAAIPTANLIKQLRTAGRAGQGARASTAAESAAAGDDPVNALVFGSDKPYVSNGFWAQFAGAGYRAHTPWKVHLFADSVEDWQKMARVVLPFLQREGVLHKTVANKEALQQLMADPQQAGKAFTLYFKDEQHMKEVVLKLHHLMKENHLERIGGIFGDRQMGSSGRIFYRYENDLQGNYRSNDGHYLPEGMEVDPFIDFIRHFLR